MYSSFYPEIRAQSQIKDFWKRKLRRNEDQLIKCLLELITRFFTSAMSQCLIYIMAKFVDAKNVKKGFPANRSPITLQKAKKNFRQRRWNKFNERNEIGGLKKHIQPVINKRLIISKMQNVSFNFHIKEEIFYQIK